MSIESCPLEREKPHTKAFNGEILKAIKELMHRSLDPTADRIFDFVRCHPGDFPYITRLRLQGMEPHLRVYLHLWGKFRGSVVKQLTPDEAREMDGTNLGLREKEESEPDRGSLEIECGDA